MTYLGATENKTPHLALNSKKGQQEKIEKCLKEKNVRSAKKMYDQFLSKYSGLVWEQVLVSTVAIVNLLDHTDLANNNFGFPNIPKMCYLAKYQNECFDNNLGRKEGIHIGKERN